MSPREADLFLFMGQSNMAGRGETCSRWPQGAPKVTPGMGYEFRAVSDPAGLYEMEEPFGKNENRIGGIDDGEKKSGSPVSAFVNAYTERCGIPVVGVSASKGGSAILQWQKGSIYLTDAMVRYHAAEKYLEQNGIGVRHRFVLWCQGETDGDLGTGEKAFKQMYLRMIRTLREEGIEKIFLISVGKCNLPDREDRYDAVRRWERELAECEPDLIGVSDAFVSMREQGLMKDAFHYYQEGYNRCGTEAGRNTADWVLNNME